MQPTIGRAADNMQPASCPDCLREHVGSLGGDFHVASEAIRSSQNAIARAVQQSGPGDVLFFHYSGHGTQVSDGTCPQPKIAD